MSSRRKPPTLDYASSVRISMLEKLSPFRWLFWPVGAALFLFVFIGLAGNGAAAGIYEGLVHLPLLAAWLLSAFGWGVLLRAACTKRRPVVAVETVDDASVEKTATTGRCFVDPLTTVTTIAAGLGMMSLAILGLGLVGFMNRPVAIGMVLIGVVIAVTAIMKRKPTFTPHVDFAHWPWLLIVPMAAMVILCALLPAGLLWGMDEPNGYDVVEYHLQVPREWYEAGHIFALHHNVYSFFPFNVEMHYLLAMNLMGGPWAGQFLAQLMHASYVALTVVAVYATVREYGRGRAMIAALLAAAPPWMPLLGAIAYNEGGFLLYGTLAIGWAMRAFSPSPGTPGEGGVRVPPARDDTVSSEENPHPTLSRNTGRGTMPLLLAGVMAGLAAGCKLTAVPLLLVGIPIAVLVIAWRQWKGVALFVLAGVLTFSPWLIRNAVWAKGNPVFPEMQSVLGRAHFSEEQSARWYRAHKPRPDQQAMSVRVAELGKQVFGDWRFGYAVLPLSIFALVATWHRREARVLLILLLVLTGFWLLETHLQGRFYVLAIPLVAFAFAYTTRAWRSLAALLAIVMILYGTGATAVRINQMKAMYGDRGTDLMTAVGFTGIDRTGVIVEFFKEDPKLMTILLVGDAEAFMYQTPSPIYYRTVFDVDTTGGRNLIDAWAHGLPKNTKAYLWISPGELQRFSRTYGLPAPEKSIMLAPEAYGIEYRAK